MTKGKCIKKNLTTLDISYLLHRIFRQNIKDKNEIHRISLFYNTSSEKLM